MSESDGGGTFTFADVEKAIADAVAQVNETHAQELEAVRQQFAGVAPANLIPTHAGGPGDTVKPTWSLAEQEAARAAAEAAA